MATKKQSVNQNFTMEDVLRAGYRIRPAPESTEVATPEPEKQTGILRTMGDVLIKGAQGVVGLGQAAVGLGNLATGGMVGEGMRSLGYDPERTKSVMGKYLSESQQAADEKVQQAQGMVDTVAAMLENPRSILGSVAESAPGMLLGGGVANAMAKKIATSAAAPLGGIGTEAGAAAAKKAVEASATKLMLAGSATEGAQGAGQIAEQAQREGRSWADYAAPAAAAGAGTALIGLGAGKLMGDAETAIFTGASSAGIKGGVAKRIGKGLLSEGVLEEMPQSAQEQVMTNVALGNPWQEGVGQAAGAGLVTGGVMGAGMGVLQRGESAKLTPKDLADQIRATESVPESGPMTRATNQAVEAKAQKVEMTAGAENAALAAMEKQTQDDLQGLRDFAGRSPEVVAGMPAAGAQPEAAGVEPTAEFIDSPFLDRIQTVQEMLADPMTRDKVRERWGVEGLNNIAYYAGMANRTGLPEKTQDNLLGMAERLLSESVLTPIQPASELGGVRRDPLTLGSQPQPQAPALGMDATPSGRFTVDPQGTAAPESRVQAMDAQRRAEEAATLGEQTPSGQAQTETTMQGISGIGMDTAPTGRLLAGQDGVRPETRMDAINIGQADMQRQAEAVRRAEMGLTPDIEAVQQRNAMRPLDGDILNPSGNPFKTKMAAQRAAKKNPGEIVEVTGGFVIRPAATMSTQQEVTGDERGNQAATAAAQGPADGVPAAADREMSAAEAGQGGVLDAVSGQPGATEPAQGDAQGAGEQPVTPLTAQPNVEVPAEAAPTPGAERGVPVAGAAGEPVEAAGVAQQAADTVSAVAGMERFDGAPAAEPTQQVDNQPTAEAAQPQPAAVTITADDVAAAEKQAAQMISDRIDGMKAADVQRIAARYLPTVGVKAPMGKARIKAAMTDAAGMNLLGPAGELGIELSDSVKRVLTAKLEGRVEAVAAEEPISTAEPAMQLAAADTAEKATAAMPIVAGIPVEAASRAFDGTSFTPERRGQSLASEFDAELRNAWDQAMRVANGKEDAIARVKGVFEDVAGGYRARVMDYLGAHGRVMSSMISGPARFPVERNRKRSEIADRKSREANEYLQRGIKRMLKAARGPIDNSPESELESVRYRLAQREELQERMKAANAAIRAKDDEALADLGFTEAEIADLKKPDFAGRIGYAPYELTNNNAEIRRLRERLASAKSRLASAQAGPNESERDGVRIVEDAQDDRLRLIFDGKPSEEVGDDLKASGFKWSPKNEAWQRQLTDNARAAARMVLDRHFPESGDGGKVAMFSRRSASGNQLPDAIIGHKLGDLNSHPDYAAAKAGDDEAALRIALDMVDDALVEKVRQAAGDADVIVPVVSVEASGRNKIPLMVAEVLADRLGSTTESQIAQANSPKRTAMDGLSRLLNPPVFDGPVQAGAAYVLVDDTLTQGGTFAALASHINDGGGKVAAAVALTGKQYSAKLSPSPELLSKVRERFQSVEDQFRAATGYGFDALTESEARYLAKHDDAESVRARITEAGGQAIIGVGARSPSLSKGRRSGLSGLTSAEAKSIADAIAKRWANAPEIVVAADMNDATIPQEVRDYDAKQRSLGAEGEPEGFWYGGKVYLVADAIRSPSDVMRVLFHESLGHYGLRGVFGKALDPILNQIAALRRADVQAKADEYGLDLENPKQRLQAAEEVLAVMAQTKPELGYVKRAISQIRSWLRRTFPKLFGQLKLTDAEIIRDYILPARGWVERGPGGGPKGGLPAMSRSQEQAPGEAPIRFSRTAAAKAYVVPALDKLNETFNHPGKLSWWHKTVGSMYNLAERMPAFKPVYEAAQNFINDVSFYAIEAADKAPKLLPRMEEWRDLAKSPITARDNKAVAAPVFEGTLSWRRDESGKPVLVEDLVKRYASLTPEQKAQRLLRANAIGENVLKMWQGMPKAQYESSVNAAFEGRMLKAGIVFTPDELKSIFKLNDAQVALYQEFRQSTDASLDNMGKSDLLRVAGKDAADLKDAVMSAPDVDAAAVLLRDHLLDLAKEDPDRSDALVTTANDMITRAERVQRLKLEGYAPLSRFGQYTVDVVVDGERQYFSMFETARDANRMAAKLKMEYGAENVAQGTLSQREFEMLQGITPETLELFGNMLGLDSTGNQAQDQVFQEYLKRTKANRSAMKRLIHRKGIAGYSEDVGRVLAAFVYSNARQTSAALHMGDLGEAVMAIPKGEGELKDAAVELARYVKEPREEAAKMRGWLFAQYLGGSIASAIVNFTQPLTTSAPYLSQFGGMGKSVKALYQAMADLKDKKFEAGLAESFRKRTEDGTLAPQGVHELMAQSRGEATLRTGNGTRVGDALAKGRNAVAKAMIGWGKLFGIAEQINRQSTYVAAYRMAAERGMADPDAFAKKVVDETQFVNNKANKMKFGRGAIGATLMTFKSYSLNWLELFHRLATQNGREGKMAAAWMVGVLLLSAGASGLPFAEDAEDLADFLAQRLGYNWSSKKVRQEFLEGLFGRDIAGFVENGVTGLPGAPIDVSGRLGMGNLIPGTGLLLKKKDHTSDFTEVLGPAGDLAKRTFQAGDLLLSGNVGQAALMIAPKAIGNLQKGVDMAQTGLYRDSRGYKVDDATTGEAIGKAIGFQPRSVAQIQEASGLNQRAKDFYRLKVEGINAKWAKAIFEKDSAAVDEVRAELKRWNRQNPDQRIQANIPAILRRVREMRKPKADRIADTAPKAMRASMREEARKMQEEMKAI